MILLDISELELLKMRTNSQSWLYHEKLTLMTNKCEWPLKFLDDKGMILIYPQLQKLFLRICLIRENGLSSLLNEQRAKLRVRGCMMIVLILAYNLLWQLFFLLISSGIPIATEPDIVLLT